MSTASPENFLPVLEYLYTDHAPLEDVDDIISVMQTADENCQPRLVNLCELYVSKEVERACEKAIERADIDVVGLLNTARVSIAVYSIYFLFDTPKDKWSVSLFFSICLNSKD